MWTERRAGFTLAEVMVVVSIVGVLASLATFSVRRYLQAAKTAEAVQTIGVIARGAVAAYEGGQPTSEILAPGAVTKSVSHRLCASAKPVPTSVPKGTKYTPKSSGVNDFNAGDDRAGWPCLRFTMSSPIYYRYQYRQGSAYVATTNSASPGPNGFEASAQGDLDADGVLSTFALSGRAHAPTGSVRIATSVFTKAELE